MTEQLSTYDFAAALTSDEAVEVFMTDALATWDAGYCGNKLKFAGAQKMRNPKHLDRAWFLYEDILIAHAQIARYLKPTALM